MPLWNIVPTWFEIERRITQDMGYQSGATFRTHFNEPVASLALNIRRINSVRTAFVRAEWEAAHSLRRRFADLDISNVLNDLLEVVAQMAMIVVGGVVTGGAIGGGIGAFGAGAGAIPLGAAGAVMGMQVSVWFLGMLGLTSVAEFFVEGLPRIAEYYVTGIRIAWEGPRGEEGLNPFSQDDPYAEWRAVHHIARGHEEVAILLLSAIVDYLTRGRGNSHVLMQEMRRSPKGARLGEWVVKHEEGLKSRKDLQRSEPLKGPIARQKAPAQQRATNHDTDAPSSQPEEMPLHEVECFSADKLPEAKTGEFERQLQGQEDGMNRLTVEEFLQNIANPVKRSTAAARVARRNMMGKLQIDYQKQLLQTLSPKDAKAQAIKIAQEKMATLAGLHNPDLRAGGKDVIADFGDRQVNSSIGPQWRPKTYHLKKAAEQVPLRLRSSTFLNVKLHKC